jgi:hypothetical protein
MKPVPRSYGVSGELKPVKPNSYGVVNMVSVLVSVADSYATKPLPLKRFGMEAEVGIELGSFTVPSLTHSVSRLILALFYKGSSRFFNRSLTAPPMPLYRPFNTR